MSPNETTPQRPLLRMQELAITNFRTFRERTVIPFAGPDGVADTIAVFHGDNGSGKSNALAALDFFFFGAAVSLQASSPTGEALVAWDHAFTPVHIGRTFVFAHRDRPHGSEGAMEIEIRFSDSRLGRLRLVCIPSGRKVKALLLRSLENAAFAPIPTEERDQLATWLFTPRGPASYPITTIDPRRCQSRFQSVGEVSLMPPELGKELFGLRTSRRPEARNQWRGLVKQLQFFEAFKGKEISVEPVSSKTPGDVDNNDDDYDGLMQHSYEIVVEDRGHTVLGLNELSSGEQHVIVLCASSLLARAGILCIQEPEISLDSTNQRLLQKILKELCDDGFIDQIILESHVPLFDGPSVIRFSRDASGATTVARQPSRDESARQLEEKAKEQGAKQRWVTRDGFTQLPEAMVDELSIKEGSHVWFLKGKNHWEAWPEAEVDDLFNAEEPNNG